MKVLVTGANGYLGRHVVKQLLNMNHEVVACDVRFEGIDQRAQCILHDIMTVTPDDYESLGRPHVMIHLAWRDGFIHNSPKHMCDLSSHYKFITSMMDQGLQHVAVMGSMHEVGYWEGAIDEETPCNPSSLYGISKNCLRMAIMSYGVQHSKIVQWLRGYYILGDDMHNHSIFTKILEAEAEGKRLFPFTTGKNKYDFEDVEELAEQIATVATQERVVGIINCCSGKPVSLAERVEQFIRDKSLKIRLDYGKFPDRPYDSPVLYGDTKKIDKIMSERNG